MTAVLKVIYWLEIVLWPIFAALVAWHVQHNFRFWMGMGIAVAGYPLWIRARAELGQSFTLSAQARSLVTTGLHSKIRHPVYVFGGVSLGGILIAWGNPIVLVLFFVLYSTQQWLRLRKEEAVLEKAFGEEYRRYKAQTWF